MITGLVDFQNIPYFNNTYFNKQNTSAPQFIPFYFIFSQKKIWMVDRCPWGFPFSQGSLRRGLCLPFVLYSSGSQPEDFMQKHLQAVLQVLFFYLVCICPQKPEWTRICTKKTPLPNLNNSQLSGNGVLKYLSAHQQNSSRIFYYSIGIAAV